MESTRNPCPEPGIQLAILVLKIRSFINEPGDPDYLQTLRREVDDLEQEYHGLLQETFSLERMERVREALSSLEEMMFPEKK